MSNPSAESTHQEAPLRTRGPKIGQRNTRQRRAVVEVLDTLTTFCSAQDIHQQLTDRGHRVGLTTVYRTLQQLASMGAIDTLHDKSGETLYRSCITEDHHHHLVCTNCRTTVEIDGGPVEAWAEDTASRFGFQKSGHTAEIFGLCSNCRTDRNA
ncbi:transcriptional repressor [Corynebacterium sp. 320]|uniref:Transcriptional repressor n=1 Tax=Corynebacterium zhongnanshanii TaxID=2768834 RepID=A0ABQ6VDA3_9CORY|nr:MULTISPECIES: Fur family transcriptional regulator [Corynebacterium]KAB1502422.1 transcriptional repressor [Corynebacterium sp. 320]KAB1551357.1 transcriptional repressor [Corynebacterium sp. 321]KAB1551814.1 transcriptional repressor [Corynebacterium sp. 319]KAB3520897.1 transcriptional repressor [Corynebacterium zhongnanshanii]KAB3526029.1 transcriptional repressor [Corynebacterium sp. 250]